MSSYLSCHSRRLNTLVKRMLEEVWKDASKSKASKGGRRTAGTWLLRILGALGLGGVTIFYFEIDTLNMFVGQSGILDDFGEVEIHQDCENCPRMVRIDGGTFIMGSPSHERGRYDSEGPPHSVNIAEAFAMSIYEVTRREFEHFAKETNRAVGASCWSAETWSMADGLNWRNPGYDQADSHPVACVGWHDAQAYVTWLSGKTGHTYRLPSEAEWEYAARAGTQTANYWGDGETEQCAYANGVSKGMKFSWSASLGVECDDGYEGTAPVGSFKPNGFGLYDMIGNVWEWTQDCWTQKYNGAPIDGEAWEWEGCDKRVLRGGSRIDSWS